LWQRFWLGFERWGEEGFLPWSGLSGRLALWWLPLELS
jgi:hypothetical protein